MQDAFPVLTPSLPDQIQDARTTHSVPTNVITKIIDRIEKMPADSPDRLRGLEIAEVCKTLYLRELMHEELILTNSIKQAVLRCVDFSREAENSAEQARKHSQDAEMHANRAIEELFRLQKLCEPRMNEESLKTLKELLKSGGFDEAREQLLKATTSAQ